MYNIQALRKRKGWTQDTLAEASGVSRILIANYESKGTGMTVTTALKLCEALNCTLDELINNDDESA